MIRINHIEAFGKHNGPGTRLVLFLQGCNFHGAFCNKPEIISMSDGKDYSVEQIMDLLEEQRSQFAKDGGLTISGGEPLLQAKKLLGLLSEVQKGGFNIVLDTNGSIWTEESRKLLTEANLVIFNLKPLDNKKHREITGASNLAVLGNIEERDLSGKPFWIRYQLVSKVTDGEKDLEELGAFCAKQKSLARLELVGENPEQINKAKSIIEKFYKNIFVK